MTPEPTPTVRLVPLTDLTDFARQVLAMRKAQRAYFEARRRMPGVAADREYREARDRERRVDAVAREILAREQVPLPGMEKGGEEFG